jgi:hypothetical protein
MLILARASLTAALLLTTAQASTSSQPYKRGCQVTAKILEKPVKKKCLENWEVRSPGLGGSLFSQGCRDAAFFAGFQGQEVWRGCRVLEAMEFKGLLK